MKTTPDYKKIYTDLITYKFPEKIKYCKNILNKKSLSILDVITLNKLLQNKDDLISAAFNQQLRSYDKDTIFKILQYQKEHNLNNSELAVYFKLSRNTIARWKRLFYNHL